MKIEVDKKKILEALQLAAGLAPQKDIYPILSNVLLESIPNFLIIKATDLKITLVQKLDCVTFENAKLLINCAKLLQICKNAPDEKINIESSGLAAKITMSDGTIKIVGEEPEKFPAIPEFFPEKKIAIGSKDLTAMISAVVWATTTERARYDLDNILFIFKKNLATAVATDGKRLAIYKSPCICEKEQTVTIPSKMIGLVGRLINVKEETYIEIKDNQFIVSNCGTFVTTRTSEAKFPPYEKVIPQNNTTTITVNKEKFLSCVHRASWCANEKNKSMEFFFGPGVISLKASEESLGDSEISCSSSLLGNPFSIKFNPDYILDIKNVKEGNEITIHGRDNISAAEIREGERFQYVVLPIKPQGAEG